MTSQEQIEALRALMDTPGFWLWSSSLAAAMLLATGMLLFFWIQNVLPRTPRPAPRFGFAEVFAGIAIFFGVQVLAGGIAATTLVLLERVDILTQLQLWDRPPARWVLSVQALVLLLVAVPLLLVLLDLIRHRLHGGADVFGIGWQLIPRGFLAGTTTWFLSIFGIFTLLIVAALTWIAAGNDPEQQAVVTLFTDALAGYEYVTLLGIAVMAVVVAPLGEEIVFRGLLFRWLEARIGLPAALLISGFVFGAIHMHWMGLVPLSVLGMLMAWLYHRTGNLWSAIFLHATFNGMQLALQLALSR